MPGQHGGRLHHSQTFPPAILEAGEQQRELERHLADHSLSPNGREGSATPHLYPIMTRHNYNEDRVHTQRGIHRRDAQLKLARRRTQRWRGCRASAGFTIATCGKKRRSDRRRPHYEVDEGCGCVLRTDRHNRIRIRIQFSCLGRRASESLESSGLVVVIPRLDIHHRCEEALGRSPACGQLGDIASVPGVTLIGSRSDFGGHRRAPEPEKGERRNRSCDKHERTILLHISLPILMRPSASISKWLSTNPMCQEIASEVEFSTAGPSGAPPVGAPSGRARTRKHSDRPDEPVAAGRRDADSDDGSPQWFAIDSEVAASLRVRVSAECSPLASGHESMARSFRGVGFWEAQARIPCTYCRDHETTQDTQ